MRVKTNGGALVSAAILAAVLTLVTVGDGSPPKPVTDPTARPAGPATATLKPMQPNPSLGVFQPEGRNAPPQPPPPPPAPKPEVLRAVTSPDRLVLQGVRGALTYLLVFVTGHLALRRFGVGGRWAYAGLGAAAALICVASHTPLQGWRNLMVMGSLSYFLGIPLVAGLIMGFVYQWRAGLEADGDDPALLEAILRGEGEAPEAVVSPDGSLVDTGQAEYFHGPLQVRTTFPVALVAALLSSGLFGLVAMAVGVPAEVRAWMASGQDLPMAQMVALAIQAKLHVIFIMGAMAPVPFAALVMLGQVTLRALGRTTYGAYLAAGAIAPPLLLTLLLGPMGFLLGLQAAAPMALAMCVYRNMAGMEPKRVKEDILVRDRRDLVGADHARRRFGRVIKA